MLQYCYLVQFWLPLQHKQQQYKYCLECESFILFELGLNFYSVFTSGNIDGISVLSSVVVNDSLFSKLLNTNVEIVVNVIFELVFNINFFFFVFHLTKNFHWNKCFLFRSRIYDCGAELCEEACQSSLLADYEQMKDKLLQYI